MNNTYYINYLSGNDDFIGSKLKPFATFEKVPDNSIVILQGKYMPVINISGKNDLTVIPEGIEKFPPRKLPIEAVLDFTTCGIIISSCKNVKITNISVSVSYFKSVDDKSKPPAKGIIFKDCTDCLMQNTELFSVRDTKGWTPRKWNDMAAGILLSDGGNNHILSNHVFNTGGIQIASAGCLADGNLIENFPTDGVGIKKYNITFSNNTVRNTHRVNGNHNDLLQFHPGVQGAKILNNIFTAYTDENQPYKDTAVQGIGGYDKTGKLLIKGNTVSVDHPNGIMLFGTQESVIDQNIVKKCGKVFLRPIRPACICIQPSKSGGLSIKNVITNNISSGYEIQKGSVIKQENNYNSVTKKYMVFN
jgi:hypothetical protein